jgi:AraC-like DNA-binding protein
MSKTLRDIVKEIQFAKDWTIEQVAKSIGYSRVHLTKEMAKGDNNELKTLLIDHHREILQNVSKGNIRLTIGKDEFQQMILEEEYQMLLKLIDAEADRLLELDKKKYGVKPPGS